eukprot:264738_1
MDLRMDSRWPFGSETESKPVGNISKLFTARSGEGFVRVVRKQEINQRTLMWHNKRYPTIGILPTGGIWMKDRGGAKSGNSMTIEKFPPVMSSNFSVSSSSSSARPSGDNISSERNGGNDDFIDFFGDGIDSVSESYSKLSDNDEIPPIFVVPFSLHSSFSELEAFVARVRPRKILPIVQKFSENIRKHFRKYLNPEPQQQFEIPKIVRSFMSRTNTLSSVGRSRSAPLVSANEYYRKRCRAHAARRKSRKNIRARRKLESSSC